MRRTAAYLALLLLAGMARGQAVDVVATARRDVAALSSAAFHGRGYTFDGHRRAAAFLETRFRTLGLEPPPGGYLQPFFLTADLITGPPRLSVDGHALRPGHDFVPLAATAPGAGQGAVADLGDGLPDGPADLAGSVAVFREALPPERARDTSWTTAERSRIGRIEGAARRGAAAVVVLVERLVYDRAPQDAPVPVFLVRGAAWPAAADSVAYAVESRQNVPVVTQNVLGLVPGTDRPDSLLLVTAHYDHLGSLGPDVYFPGANDNASGVAMLLALAGHFRAHPHRYSMLFVAFSGEEVGLYGSRHFVTHPVVDLSTVRFVLNFDMVASGEDGITAVGGADHPAAFERLAALDTTGVPLHAVRNRPNSDQYFLLRLGIPGFYLYTTGGRQPYHHVEDRPETLEWDDFWQVYDLSRRFLERL